MHFKIKTIIWQQIDIKDDLNVDRLLSALAVNSDDAYDEVLSGNIECMSLYETEKPISPKQNGGYSTLELYDDNDKIVWQNGD